MPAPELSPEETEQTQALLNELLPWLALPPIGWSNAVAGYKASDEELGSLVNALDKLAIHAARLSQYVEIRVGGGGHPEAVQHSNAVVFHVRKALGYTVPENDIYF